MTHSRNARFTFGEGIEYVLNKIAFPENTRVTFNEDAQVLENSFVNAVSSYDPMFRAAFKGLSLGGSYLDGIKIHLPEEFDMHVKIQSECIIVPVCVPNRPGFVFLWASSDESACVRHFENEGYYISRFAVQNWFRNSITAIMPKLQKIRCKGGRVYRMEYTAHGTGVAHTLVATELNNLARKISFDFVPVFAFPPNKWPQQLKRPQHDGQNWFAVPRKYFDTPETQDSRSFILCAPHWERLVLHKKMNLKNSLRLMKALRNSNELSGLVSYFLKSIYLNTVDKRNIVNWNQSPGRILIRMLINLLHAVRLNNLPFYLAPDYNNLDRLTDKCRREYVRVLNKIVRKLIKRRDADYLTEDDLLNIFGVEVNDD